MATGKALNGKPYAGNPHVRFDEGEVASAATPRRGSLLYSFKVLKIGRGASRRVRSCCGTLAVVSVFCIATASSQLWADNPSILSNGSFESYTLRGSDTFPDTQKHLGLDGTRSVLNWTHSSSGAGICASGDSPFLGGGDVPDGSAAVYLQNSGTISQSVTITDAGTYEVSFRYAGRSSYTGGCIYVKIVDSSNAETTLASFACPVTVFRTAYAKTYLTPGTYTLKLEHAKSSSDSGDSIIDRVEMKLMDNLISNGSFEDYRNETDASFSYKTFVQNTFVPEAWSYSGTLVLTKGSSPYVAGDVPDGEVAVVLRGNAVLSQTIIAPTTGVYEVSFKYINRQASGNGTLKIFANIDDEPLGSVSCTTNAIRTAYFKAYLTEGTSYTLSITNNATGNATATDSSIDCVSVIASTNLILNGGFDYGTIDPSKNSGTYLQSNQAGYVNPFWTESGSTGRMGLAIGGSTWVNAALDVGTYAFYMQTLSGYAGDSVWQDFKVDVPGVYRLSFVHAKRANTVNPVTKARIRRGKGLDGEIVYEKEATSSHVDVFEQFAADVKLHEAGVYTLEFHRESTADNIASILDNVSLMYDRKIHKGLVIVVK